MRTTLTVDDDVVAHDRCFVAPDHRVSKGTIVGATDRRVLPGRTPDHVPAPLRAGVAINACTSAPTRIGLVT